MGSHREINAYTWLTDATKEAGRSARSVITASTRQNLSSKNHLVGVSDGEGLMMLMNRRAKFVAQMTFPSTLIAFVLGFFWEASTAMMLKEAGDQLILSGPVLAGDAVKVRQALAGNPGIRTVILRNSPGGDVPTGYEIGELMREKGLRTAVSGFCNSSCSRMFLGGKERFFTDDYSLSRTRVGFHGHYYTTGARKGQLNTQQVNHYGLKDWIIRHSDGKADPDLVERWINIPVNVGMMHFFHPRLAEERKFATFFCKRGPAPGTGVFGCEPVSKNALDLGIVTSLEIISSNDQAGVRASLRKNQPQDDE